MIDSNISHFKILQKIGEGGMGEIYLAEDAALNRRVALKLLPPHLIEKPDLVTRFRREARAAAALKHPNIVTVYELFEQDGRIFIAMEYIDGANLHQFIKQRAITIKQALVIVLHICKGLEVAHKHGIIHRDLKPANIMIDKDGWVKLLDFGLAKLITNKTITRAGSRMGTIPYFSPEQLRGEELRPATDIFSLGIILYELIARRLPFDGETEENIMFNILHKKPERLAKFNSEVTSRLQKIIEKALDKNPAKRYQSISQFMDDLKREKHHYGKQKHPIAGSSGKNAVAFNVSLYLRDIESSIQRFSVSNLINVFGFMKRCIRHGKAVPQALQRKFRRMVRSNFNIRAGVWGLHPKKIGQSLAFPLAVLFLLAMLSGAIIVKTGTPARSTVDAVSKTSPIRTLMQIKDTASLLKAIDVYRRRNLIAVSEDVSFTSSDHCYLIVFDSQKVIDIFAIRGDLLFSLYSRKTYQKSTHKLAGAYRIWVQDLRADSEKMSMR